MTDVVKAKKVNSRAKGVAFELKVAKLFAAALGIKLRRTPLSGGWSHGNPETAGDLVCVEDGVDFPFCVECKCEENWRLESLFTDNHNWFDKYWAQLDSETTAGHVSILVFTRNRAQIFVAFRAADFDELPVIRKLCVEEYTITLLSDFLAAVTV